MWSIHSLALLSLLSGAALAGLVKRDTAADIENSLKNVFGSNDNPLEDLQEGGACLLDSQCVEPIQFCNRENPLNMHCQFVVWVWVGVGVAAGLLLLSVCASCLCCSCCCLHSLCRKK